MYNVYTHEMCVRLLIVSIAVTVVDLGGVDGKIRPRGVSLSKASLYDEGRDFVCFDSSSTITYDKVNDDYCDCNDGSDEPGTSACPNGLFHCTNAGYLPKYIPSSRVCDGICDCCDGSDEYCDNKCVNDCKELGKQYREDREAEVKLAAQGSQIRQEYIKQGLKEIEDKKMRLQQLEKDKADIEAQKNELEGIKNTAEGDEKAAKDKHEQLWNDEKSKRDTERDHNRAKLAFGDFDSNQDQTLTHHELQIHTIFDTDSDGTVTEAETKEHLGDADFLEFIAFHEKVWPKIKDAYKTIDEKKNEYLTEEAKPPPPVEQEHPPEPDDTSEPPHDDDDDNEDDLDDKDDDDEKPNDLEDDKGEKTKQSEEKKGDGENEGMPPYDDATNKLIETADLARKTFNEVNTKFSDIDNEMNDINKLLNLDLGPDNVFFPIKGACYDFTDREYTYSLCAFDRVTQKPKNGGSTTELGTWGHWSGGDDDSKYNSMKYEGGTGCWNGPARSSLVKLTCGMTNELYSAAEPNRCEYEFEFRSPALCQDIPDKNQGHDEL